VIYFGTCCLDSLLTLLCSGTFQMLTVTHFTKTLLEAVEEELKVRGTFSYPCTALNPSSSHSIGLPS
jgi:hypothetical protein